MGNISIKSPDVFSGFVYIGHCQEFIWIPEEENTLSRFVICGLSCDFDVESLAIRKDLFLLSPEGEEYIVDDFLLTDVSDPKNVFGKAKRFAKSSDRSPELEKNSRIEPDLISKTSQVLAVKAVSSMIASVKSKHQVDGEGTGQVVDQLVADVIRTPNAVMNLLAARSFDDYIFSHNINVATISIMLGNSMNLSREQLHALGVGALLHDIGRLRIALSIWNKEGELTEAEKREVQQHPVIGYQILEKSKEISDQSKLVVLQHHEKFDGKGYPTGIRNGKISTLARIVAIADVYDALTTKRPYRPALSPYDSVKTLLSSVDNHFDAEILKVFLKKLSLYPPGSAVSLNDHSVAMVVKVNPSSLLRPVVKLLRDSSGKEIPSGPEIDLSLSPNLFIVGPANL